MTPPRSSEMSPENYLPEVSIMKHIIPIFLIFLTGGLTGQITVTNETFPQVGDTLFTRVDNLPEQISITAAGPGQNWDFSSLEAPFTQQMVIKEANVGMFFPAYPSADVLVELQGDAEGYFKISNKQIENMGFVGEDPIGLGINAIAKYEPRYIERRAPMNYQNSHTSESNLSLPFSTDDLPSGIFDELPITPDSLRLRIAYDRTDEVDAWGTIQLPEGLYDVLREKRTEIRAIRLDAKLSILPWQDITELLPAEAQFEPDTAITYYHFSNEAKEPVAILYTSNNGSNVSRVEYKAGDTATNVLDFDSARPGIYAYPNPALEYVRFELANLKPGNYKLKLYNILGVEVWSKNYRIRNNITDRIDITSFRKGTYLYSLIDGSGKTIITKRLMVLRP